MEVTFKVDINEAAAGVLYKLKKDIESGAPRDFAYTLAEGKVSMLRDLLVDSLQDEVTETQFDNMWTTLDNALDGAMEKP